MEEGRALQRRQSIVPARGKGECEEVGGGGIRDGDEMEMEMGSSEEN